MDSDVIPGPPCLEKEMGVADADSRQHCVSNIIEGMQSPPPLTLEGIRGGSHSSQKKLGIFARVYPTKRGATTVTQTRQRPSGNSPRGLQSSSSRSLFSQRSSGGKPDIHLGADRGRNINSPTRSRGRLTNKLFGLERMGTLPDGNFSPRRSIGKAPPVGIFGVNRSPPTLPNNRTTGSPRTRGKSWIDRCGPLANARRPPNEVSQRRHAEDSMQDVCIVSRVSPIIPSRVSGTGLMSSENIQNGVEKGSDLDDSSSDESGMEELSPSGCPSPSRASPRKERHKGSSDSIASPTHKLLQNCGAALKRGAGRGRRGSRGKLGTRGRGMMTRLRDPTRDLLVEGKRNSPLRRKMETDGLGTKLMQSASSGSVSGKFGSTGLQGSSSRLISTGRGSSRGRGTAWSRGARWRGRGRGRGKGRVRTRGGLGRGQTRNPGTANSLSPFSGSTSYGQTKAYYDGFLLSNMVSSGIKQDKRDLFDNPLAAGVGLDKNANVTGIFPPVRILSIEDVTTGHRSRALSPVDVMKGHKTGSPTKSFKEGEDVLARWTDGLVYLGTIQKVEADKEQCFVTFEDNSEHWVLFKDIQKGPTEVETEDITCVVCDLGESEPPNEIIICDKCGTGFHQLCHQPFIESYYVTSEELQWLCRKCIFASAAKVGGASNKGQAAKMFQEVKRSLPYKIEVLTWDKHHRTNTQKCYCYCGGPGEWYLKMLQCCRCMQWFHEACIQCLSTPMLYGDRFYLFVCSVCNSGPEYIRRLPLKWVELTHLILYNLSLIHCKKYFTLDEDIVPFLNLKWTGLQVDHLATRRAEKESVIWHALQSHSARFACGKEVRKKKDLWGIRTRTPPVPPAVVLPAVGQINDEVMNNLGSIEESKFMTFVPFGSTTPVPQRKLLKQQQKKERLSKLEEEKRTKKARKRLLAATSSDMADRPLSANQSYQGYSGTHPAPPKVRRVCKTSILDTIEPLEDVIRKQRHPVAKTIHHPRCSVPSTGVHLSSPVESPPVKRKPGRPRKTDVIEDKKKGKHGLKHAKKRNDLRPRRTSPRSRTAEGNPGEASVSGCPKRSGSDRALLNSMTTYFGAEGRIASGENYKVLAKRKSSSGKMEYLIQWEGTTP